MPTPKTWTIYTLVKHWTEGINNANQPMEHQRDTAVFTTSERGDTYVNAAIAAEDPATYELREQSIAYDPVKEPERLKLPLDPTYQPSETQG